MSFKFDFFNEDEKNTESQTLARSGDDLTPIFETESKQLQSSLPNGKADENDVTMAIQAIASSKQQPERHELPNSFTILTLNGGAISQSDNIAKRTDVLPGRYEGGYKIWECSFDALSCLATLPPPNRMLDLGCGAGLVGIWALKAWRQSFIAFHDLNLEVLQRATIPNVVLNGNDLINRSSFYYGPWQSSPMLEDNSFDLIVTADTLYDPETLGDLYKVIMRCLVVGGRAIIAAKRFYFGVGGGVSTFTAIANERGNCQTRTLTSFQDGSSNIRDVLELVKLR